MMAQLTMAYLMRMVKYIMINKEFGDKYIGMKVLLPYGDALLEAIVQSRKRTTDGNQLVGKENSNPILDM